MKISNFTPNLITKDMAASLQFYTGLLDFSINMHVPDEPPFAWAQVSHGSVEIMLQEAGDFQKDLGIDWGGKTGGTLLFHAEVTDIQGWFERLASKVKVVTPMRETFYGMKEFGFLDPDGYLIVFAERV